MPSQSDGIRAWIEPFQGREWDAHYLGFFDCFNRGLYFEAHEVLEVLWLEQKTGPNGDFYKGLIQLAGAFVHLQKGRAGPAAALLRSADGNLRRYPPAYEGLALSKALTQIRTWRQEVESGRLDVRGHLCLPESAG